MEKEERGGIKLAQLFIRIRILDLDFSVIIINIILLLFCSPYAALVYVCVFFSCYYFNMFKIKAHKQTLAS